MVLCYFAEKIARPLSISRRDVLLSETDSVCAPSTGHFEIQNGGPEWLVQASFYTFIVDTNATAPGREYKGMRWVVQLQITKWHLTFWRLKWFGLNFIGAELEKERCLRKLCMNIHIMIVVVVGNSKRSPVDSWSHDHETLQTNFYLKGKSKIII